jgi:hypothetical protein
MHGESPLAGPIAGSPPLPALAAAATPATASSGRDATRQDEIDEMVRTSLRKLIGTPEAADKPTP